MEPTANNAKPVPQDKMIFIVEYSNLVESVSTHGLQITVMFLTGISTVSFVMMAIG